MKKRWLSVLLTFCMMLTMLPVSVFATGSGTGVAQIEETTYETLDAAVEAAKEGDTIVLLQDLSDVAVTVDKSIILDLNEHTISGQVHSNSSAESGSSTTPQPTNYTPAAITIGSNATGAVEEQPQVESFTLKNGTISLGTGLKIYDDLKTLIVEDVIFQNNVASNANQTEGGAAVNWRAGRNSIAEGTSARFSDCQFLNNKSYYESGGDPNGGAILLSGVATAQFDTCTFTGNESSGTTQQGANNGTGGAVFAAYCGGISFEACIFKNNIANSDTGGGAVYTMYCGNTAFKNCEFEENNAVNGAGGALALTYATAGAQNTIENSTFSENTAGVSGGAIWISEADVSLDANTTVAGNSAANGGAIMLQGKVNAEVNCDLTDNTASGYGGAVWVYGQAALAINGDLRGNEAANGGAVYAQWGYYYDSNAQMVGVPVVTITGDLTENSADTNGGAIYNNIAKVTVVGEITGNSAGGTGGGIYSYNGSPTSYPTTANLLDAAVYNNEAGVAGADIYHNGGFLQFPDVGKEWTLSECNHAIDGWYDDSENNRWSAHNAPAHTQLVDASGEYLASGPFALKAAHGLEPIQPGDETGWDISKSKTATNLDENYESQITLSLPAAEETLTSDIVFVIDDSTSSLEESTEEGLAMLGHLADALESTQASIKVGVIAFDGTSHILQELTDYDEELLSNVLSAGIPADQHMSGTNIEAGLMAAQTMLEADSTVQNNRKHVILVSDGLTRLFSDEEGTTQNIFHQLWSDGTTYAGDLAGWGVKYGFEDAVYDMPYGSWEAYYAKLIEWVTKDQDTYAVDFANVDYRSWFDNRNPFPQGTPYIPAEEVNEHAVAVDRAFYDAYQAYQTLASKFNCYAIYTGSSEMGQGFMSALNDGAKVDFDSIYDDIYYLLDEGSTVEDYMGYVADDYNFNFVNDASKLTMKVGNVEYKAVSLGKDQYGFVPNDSGEYNYVLTYVPGDKTSDEHFVWEINVPVSNFAPVQLIYSVKLVNPKTVPGTYGTYDEDGSKEATGLYTNNEAVLTPVDSNGVEGLPEAFHKPTVSYTVAEPINSLTISKTVNGTTDPDILDDKFTFTVQLPDGSYSYRYTTGSDTGKTGTIQDNGTLTLQNGETVVIDGIPVGTVYTVSETADRDFQTTVAKTDGAASFAVLSSEDAVSATGTIGAGGASAVHFVNTYDPAILTIRPADLTIYMGGSEGENAVVDADGETTENASSLPTPLFYITVPSNIATDNLRFVSSETVGDAMTAKSWKAIQVGTDSNEVPLYYLEPEVTGQDEVRIQYTDTDNDSNVIVSDQFSPTAVHELYNDYTAEIYPGTVDAATITVYDGDDPLDLTLSVGTGNLRVRAVEDFDAENDAVVKMQTDEPSSKLDAGTAAITAPKNTTYTLNDTTIEVDSTDIGLLFDGIIDDSTANRTAALQARIDAEMGSVGSRTTRHYQAQYLDLVDQNHGNAWVKASQDVTVYWAYPTDTNANTNFTLYHFSGLHRDGENSGFNIADVSTAAVEKKDLTLGENAISFTVGSGDFSPYVLVWETTSSGGSSGGGSPSTPSGDDGPELNKEDHIAYVSGYPDGTVQPDGYITREEVATIFFRLLTDASRANYITNSNPFPDVDEDRWSFYSITTMNNGSLMSGRPNGLFDPADKITRAEFAVVAAQFSNAQYTGPDKFSDISDHWARDYINRAAAEGWIAGYPDGTFGPDRYITRAEVMALVNEVLDHAPDADYMLEDMVQWPDNPESAWYYEDVQEATNCHSYVWRDTDHTSEEWKELISMRSYEQLVRDAFNGVGITQ